MFSACLALQMSFDRTMVPNFSSSRFQQFCQGVGRVASHFVSRLPPVKRPRRSCRQIHEETFSSLPGLCWYSNKVQWTKGMFQYRNTPTKHGPSPAQLLFGQPVQDMVPSHHCAFKPEYQKAADTSDTLPADTKAVIRYDSSAHPLLSFQIGTPVLVQNDRIKLWDLPA